MILLTGCAGFIGWKVGELLLEEGHAVCGIDELNNAYDVRLKQWRLEQLSRYDGFTFHRIDISDYQTLSGLFASKGQATRSSRISFDVILNLGARAGVRQSFEGPWVYYAANVTGTLNLLELSKRHGIQKFILASTSSVYGEGERPFRENQATDRPLSPYAASKKAAEALCYAYQNMYGIDVTVLRYFTVYGPAGRPDMSIFRFVQWISNREPVIVYGDGNQERDFTYVDDIARGTLAATKHSGYQIINLGSSRPEPLHKVITLLEAIIGKKARVEHREASPADVPGTWADINKAKKLLGWEPLISLETGLRRTVFWNQQNEDWARKIQL